MTHFAIILLIVATGLTAFGAGAAHKEFADTSHVSGLIRERLNRTWRRTMLAIFFGTVAAILVIVSAVVPGGTLL